MSNTSVQEIVETFVEKVTGRLDAAKLDGPVRLDPTRSIVIIPVKGRGEIHAYTDHQINDDGVEHVVKQLQAVPSLSGLVK